MRLFKAFVCVSLVLSLALCLFLPAGAQETVWLDIVKITPLPESNTIGVYCRVENPQGGYISVRLLNEKSVALYLGQRDMPSSGLIYISIPLSAQRQNGNCTLEIGGTGTSVIKRSFNFASGHSDSYLYFTPGQTSGDIFTRLSSTVSITRENGALERTQPLKTGDTLTLSCVGLAQNTVFTALLLGDVDFNDSVDAVDAMMILQASVGLIIFTSPAAYAADTVRYGAPCAAGALQVLQYSVGKTALR